MFDAKDSSNTPHSLVPEKESYNVASGDIPHFFYTKPSCWLCHLAGLLSHRDGLAKNIYGTQLHCKPDPEGGVEIKLNDQEFYSAVQMMARLLVTCQSPPDFGSPTYIVPEYGDERVLEESIGISEDIMKITFKTLVGALVKKRCGQFFGLLVFGLSFLPTPACARGAFLFGVYW